MAIKRLGALAPWKSWLSAAGLAALLIVAFMLVSGGPLWQKSTFGRILVDSPEIYTRERLVNDRFMQEAWLSRELSRASGVRASEHVVDQKRGLIVGVGAAAETSTTKPETPAQPGTDAPRSPVTRDAFMEELDYRELIRNLTIENQLDDRHDLYGNSLYKLKFDASVLPGSNTQAHAQITVQLYEPEVLANRNDPPVHGSLSDLGSKAQVEFWRALYGRWIESLAARLNQTHMELTQAFELNQLPRDDYARFVTFVDRLNSGNCASEMNESHAKGKQCVLKEALRRVKPSIEEPEAQPFPATVAPGISEKPVGEYILVTRKLTPEEIARQASLKMDGWKSLFFAGKSVRLVLGASVPEHAFAGNSTVHIPTLENLAKLTFYQVPDPGRAAELRSLAKLAFYQVPDSGTQAEKGFLVRAKTFDVLAVDPRTATQETLNRLFVEGLIPKLRLSDFKTPVEFAPQEEFLVLENAMQPLGDLKLSRKEFDEIKPETGVLKVVAQPGLYQFAQIARQHMAAFSYSVTPKETADTVNSTISIDSQLIAAAGAADEGSKSALRARREFLYKAMERRPTVVGFAGSPNDGARAEFGWLIAPGQLRLNGQSPAYVQAPSQYSLSALVSIPAWWGSIRLRVVPRWIDRDGDAVRGPAQEPISWTVDLPVDFEALEPSLLGIEQIGPELMERLDSVTLTACQRGAILIPGRRLWRSTKVTLGYQMADAIAVLPNMKGIIASFDRVENQASAEEESRWKHDKAAKSPRQITRMVRVWTSQGSLTLPTPATIGVPDGVQRRCPERERTSAENPGQR